MLYNLLTPEGVLLRNWDLSEDFKDNLNAVFPNEFEKIQKKELLVHLGVLPENYIIEDNQVVEVITPEPTATEGGMETWEQ